VRVVYLIVFLVFITIPSLVASPVLSKDTTYTLDEVVVRSCRLHDFAVGTQIQIIDTSVLQHYRNQSLAELLSEQTAITVNTYGPGGLATVSTRGGGSEHTAVIWNGFILRNPMNAGLNFSGMPVSLFDGLTIQYGGASTLFGSGATTSTIHLNNSLNFNKGFSIDLATMGGSFSTFNQSAIISYSSKKLASATRFYYQTGANDFKFVNTEKQGNPIDTLKNASYKGYALMQQNAYQISTKSIVRADLWYQRFFKNVPSLMSDSKPGNTNQADENIRLALNYARSTTKLLLYLRSGIFSDKTIYTDPVQYPDGAVSRAISNINELETKYLISPRHNVNLGINYTFETAQSDDYVNRPKRERIALFGSYLYKSSAEKLLGVVNIRQEIVDGLIIPVVYSAGFDYELIRQIHFVANASKNYMLPTFNNLYWGRDAYAEGNPNLKPESGYSIEGGTKLVFETGGIRVTNELTCYWSIINNWIIWMPDSLKIYKPENFNKGNTNGIELKGSVETKNTMGHHKIFYLYTYVNAKMSDYNPIDETTTMKSLLYVPKHKASLNYSLTFKQYSFTTSLVYYGKRYYDYVDVPLPEYALIGITVERCFELGNQKLEIYLKVNNLTNAKYQVMKDYAMPPTNFMFGINLKLNK
jgi:vitamin B12 transporter